MKISKSLIFSVLGCVGVGATTAFAINNTEKVVTKKLNGEELNKKDIALAYLPTIVSAGATCGCIAVSQVISMKELAAATTAIGVMSTKYKELANELCEKHPDIYEELEHSINESHLDKALNDTDIDCIEGNGKELYFESFTEQVFYASEKELLEAQCDLNEKLFNDGVATLYDYLANFSEDSGVKLKNWMKYIGWYEGDTSYSYSSGYYGCYVKPLIERQNVTFHGHRVDANVIRWIIYPDYDPELNENEIGCIETAIDTEGDI